MGSEGGPAASIFLCPAQTPSHGHSGSGPSSKRRVPKVPARIQMPSDPAAEGRQATKATTRYMSPATRCPGNPTPRHGRRLHTHLTAGLRPWITSRPEDFSSHNTPQGVHPSSNPVRGLAGMVRWARTPPQVGKTWEAELWRRSPAGPMGPTGGPNEAHEAAPPRNID